MTDKLSQEEINALTGQPDLSEFKPLLESFDSGIETAKDTLASLTNINSISSSTSNLDILNLKDLNFDNGNLLIRIGLKSGIAGCSYVNISKECARDIASAMMGVEDELSLSEDLIHSALQEAMNQIIGSVCTNLSRGLNGTIDITTPELVETNSNNASDLLNGSFKKDSDICKVSYSLSILNHKIEIIFIFTVNTAKSASFKIKTTESRNLLRLNPELSKNIAEYFTLLGVKYKAIYSMLGIMDDVSVVELNSIHSLQCLDVDVINNYNVVNKNQQDNIYNVFIFEKEFVADVRDFSGLESDENVTWDILKELNNQFSYVFLNYSSDNKIRFDNVECNNFLELPDNQYLLVTYSVRKYTFYQLLSFDLIEKIKHTFNKIDRNKIDNKSIEKLIKYGYNCKNIDGSDNTEIGSVNSIPPVLRKISFEVSAELGEKMYSIRDLLHFNTGYIIHFDTKVSDDVDIYINNVKKAEGEVGELTYNKSNNYAVKIKKIMKEQS